MICGPCVCCSHGWTTNTRCLVGWWKAWRWLRTSATSRCTLRLTSLMTTFALSTSPSNEWKHQQDIETGCTPWPANLMATFTSSAPLSKMWKHHQDDETMCISRLTSLMTTFTSSTPLSNEWQHHQDTDKTDHLLIGLCQLQLPPLWHSVILPDFQQKLGIPASREKIVKLSNTAAHTWKFVTIDKAHKCHKTLAIHSHPNFRVFF